MVLERSKVQLPFPGIHIQSHSHRYPRHCHTSLQWATTYVAGQLRGCSPPTVQQDNREGTVTASLSKSTGQQYGKQAAATGDDFGALSYVCTMFVLMVLIIT